MESPKEEEKNFLRVIKVLYGVAPQAVREKFHKYFPPQRWPGILNAEETMLKSQRRLTAKQISILFPSSGIPSSTSNYDITLMIYLLRNLTEVQPPSNGFDVLPPASEIHDGADLARIKYYRNRYAHFETDKLTSTDFLLIWEDITEAIVRLGGPSYLSVVNKIKSSAFNDEYLVNFREDLEATREELRDQIKVSTAYTVKYVQEHIDKMSSDFADIFDETTEIKKAIQTVSTRCNCYDAHELLIKEWEKDDSCFVNTYAVNKMIKHIKLHYGMMVIGTPGIGKSSTIHHIALYLRNYEDFAIIPCSNPLDIKQHYKEGIKQVFLIDDICGRQYLNKNDVEEWLKEEYTIALILNKENVKILMSCRLQIYFETQFERMTLLTQFTFDLSSDTFALSFRIRKKIANKYLTDDVVKTIIPFIKHPNFSPLLCRLGKDMKDENDVICLFRNPYEHYKLNIQELSKAEDKYKYFVLFLFVCSNGYIDGSFLEQKKIDLVFTHLGYGSQHSIQRFKEELNSLNRTYLLKTKDCTYKTIHNRQFEYLSYYFGENLQRELIRFADVRMIHHHMYLECSDIIRDDLCIKLNNENEEEYLLRLRTDWSNGEILNVFYNRHMESENFRCKFLFFLNKLDKKDKSNLIQTRAIECDSLMALHLVCIKGYVDLLEFILEDMNSTEDVLNEVMFDSCLEGKLDVVKCLIGHGVSVKRVTHGRFPLYAASLSGVKYIQDMILSFELKPFNDEIFEKIFVDTKNRNFLKMGLATWIQTFTKNFSFKEIAYITSFVLGWNDENRITHLLREDNIFSKDIIDALRGVMRKEYDNHNFSILDVLLKNGADINETDEGGKSTLSYMCFIGQEKMVRYLVQKGANINKCDIDGMTPLHAAVLGSFTSVASFLLDNGAHINARDKQGRTSLWWAIHLWYPNIVSFLLDKDIDVNKGDEHEITPLTVAIASITKKETCLDIACRVCSISIIDLLFRHSNFNLKDENVAIILVLGCRFDKYENVKKMILNGVDINHADFEGWTVLLEACSKGNLDFIVYLVSNFADFNQSDRFEWTPLMEACKQGHLDIVAFLIDVGADVNKVDDSGSSCFTIACQYGYKDIVQILLDNECNPRQQDVKGRDSLFAAVEGGHLEIVKYLIDIGADVNRTDSDGSTVLIEACIKGDIEILNFLIHSGAEINKADKKGRTALMEANRKGQNDIINILKLHDASEGSERFSLSIITKVIAIVFLLFLLFSNIYTGTLNFERNRFQNYQDN